MCLFGNIGLLYVGSVVIDFGDADYACTGSHGKYLNSSGTMMKLELIP